MSKRNGDKARSNRERKKMLRRKRNRESQRASESKATGLGVPNPTGDENQIVSSRLRRLTGDSKADSDQGEHVLEIVVYQVPRAGQQDE